MISTAPLLAIDTSTTLGSVALGSSEIVLGEATVGIHAKHAEALLPTVDFILNRSQVSKLQLSGVVVAAGPGSFTGLRIAAATAKGLVRALGVPLFAYSGLLSLAASASFNDEPVCALFDARRGEVYAACYRFPNGKTVEILLEPGVRRLEDVLSTRIAVRYVGDGALRYRAQVEAIGARVAAVHASIPRASALLWLADVAADMGRVLSPETWEPAYMRESGAQRGVAV